MRPKSRLSKAIEKKPSYDIETWVPWKMTNRNWFMMIVIGLNVPIIAFCLYKIIPLLGNAKDSAFYIILSTIIILAIMLISLIGVWMLYKVAVYVYLGTLVAIAAVEVLCGKVPSTGIFMTIMFFLSVKSVWNPSFIPEHIKQKWNLT